MIPNCRSGRWVVAVSVALTVFFLSIDAGGQIPDRKNGLSEQNSRDVDDHIELVVTAEEGRVQWKDVAASLAESLSVDVAVVEKILPRGSVNVRSEYIGLASAGVRLASRGKVSIAVTRDKDDRRALKIRCDRSIFGVKTTAMKPVTIDLDEDWSTRTAGRPLLICLHGLRSDPNVWRPFRAEMRGAGFATAAVGYDDRLPIAESAQQVAEVTADAITADAPQGLRLALVGHSMGGLVAREWTENPELAGQAISHLITVATPHRGSNWASMPPLLDLVSKGKFDLRDVVDVVTHQNSSAGVRDMQPGSKQLEEMASRPRRADVRYTTIVGTGSPIAQEHVERLGKMLRSIDEKSTAFQLMSPRIRPLIDGFDELMRGKGDGAVAADKAVIEGVSDIVRFDLSHAELIRPVVGQDRQPVWDEIRKRLE